MSSQQNLQDDESLELVKVCGPTEAEMIGEMLRNNGIESTLQGELSATQLPATSATDAMPTSLGSPLVLRFRPSLRASSRGRAERTELGTSGP